MAPFRKTVVARANRSDCATPSIRPSLCIDKGGKESRTSTSQRGRPKGRKVGEVKRDPRNNLIMSKCDVKTAMTFLDCVIKKLSEEDIEALSKTPFLHLLCMPHIMVCRPQLHEILLRYLKEKYCFQEKGADFIFREDEVCIILGLPYGGQRVELERTSKPSKLHTEFFKGAKSITKEQLEHEIVNLSSREHDKNEMAGFIIMYIFTTILFTQMNGHVPIQFFKYVDEIDKICDFSWGRAVFKYLSQHIETCAAWVKEMVKNEDVRENTTGSHLPGCTFALVVWFYEHLNNQEWSNNLSNIPRYLNWHLDQYPKRSSAQNQIKETVGGSMIDKLKKCDVERIIYDKGYIANDYRDIMNSEIEFSKLENKDKQVVLKSFVNVLKKFNFPLCPTLLEAQGP